MTDVWFREMWKIEKFERISRKTVKINKQILTSLPDTESITRIIALLYTNNNFIY